MRLLLPIMVRFQNFFFLAQVQSRSVVRHTSRWDRNFFMTLTTKMNFSTEFETTVAHRGPLSLSQDCYPVETTMSSSPVMCGYHIVIWMYREVDHNRKMEDRLKGIRIR